MRCGYKNTAMKQKIRDIIKEELELARKAECERTVRRVIKLMCIELHDNRGFGHDRLAETITNMTERINSGLEYWENDTGDFWYKIDTMLRDNNIQFFLFEDDCNDDKIILGDKANNE